MSKPATIQYCGHSAIILTTEEGLRVAVDPFLEGNPTCPAELYDPGKLDLIVLTHGHGDHVGSTVMLAKRYSVTVCATFELATLLGKEGVTQDQLQYMNKGGTVSIPGTSLKVTLTHAFHSSSFDTSKGETLYAGEPCGAVVHLESGRTVYHAGDTALFSDMKLIGEEYRPILSCLPIGDRFTMGPREAARAAQFVGAKFAIPIHHGTFPMLSGTPAQFLEALRMTDVEGVALKPGESFSF